MAYKVHGRFDSGQGEGLKNSHPATPLANLVAKTLFEMANFQSPVKGMHFVHRPPDYIAEELSPTHDKYISEVECKLLARIITSRASKLTFPEASMEPNF